VSIDLKKIISQTPPVFFSVLEELTKNGYVATLVGGSVRDFFLNGKLGDDWDIELTHQTIAFNKSDWKDFGKSLSRFGKVSFLPYEIIRVDSDKIQMEFSPPRIEHYHENAKGHSNFDAEFDFKLPFDKAVGRRDFTLNAMGIRYINKKEVEFLDPLEGLRHLRDKCLFSAGAEFTKDPVRFLRAYRFSQKYNFEFSVALSDLLKSMDLNGLTPTYLWAEMQKSGNPLSYLSKLVKAKKTNPSLKLPLNLSPDKLEEMNHYLHDPQKHESWLIALEWVDISSDQWTSYFNLSSESARRLGRWARTTKQFQNILPESFQGEFEDIRVSKDFDLLFDWYFTTKQLLQKHPDLPLMKMIGEYLPNWIHLYRFEAPKDVKHIDPPLRAKYQVWNLCQRI
jgi:tRNA nucleotidyltransferase/poly(A) polymerase